jgi:hypothetical protein
MFYTNKYSDYMRHLTTQKHKKLLMRYACSTPGSIDPNSNSYVCHGHGRGHGHGPGFTCTGSVTSTSVSEYSVHGGGTDLLASSAHQHQYQPYKCKHCARNYSARNSAWYHEKHCKQRAADESSNSAAAATEVALACQNKTKDEVIDRLLKDNAEMMKLLKEIVPRIGPTTMIMNTTNHNKFNINVFLNEHCKDAVNISDFVNSIKITMQDLKLTEERGIVESISNVLVQGLNDMDICKRPIHCTDLKRDIMYVKENEQWERDDTQEHLRKSVNDIAYKQILSVENWKNTLPNLNCDESLQLQYNTLLMKTLADTTGEKDVKKIVKSVCKHVYLSDTPPQIQNQAAAAASAASAAS